MSSRRAAFTSVVVLIFSLLFAVTPSANAAGGPVALTLPAGTAFSVLGHSCGGIQQQDVATGFGADGGPVGAVYLQTRCGGSGRGGGYHVTTYSAWVAVTWDLSAQVTSSAVTATPPVLPVPATITDSRGDALENVLSSVNVPPANCSPGNVTYCTYRAYLSLALPGAPTGVGVSESSDALIVTWSAPADGGPVAATTVTAAPDGGSSVTLTGATSSSTDTTLTLPGAAPSTKYTITVTFSNAAGSGPASAPVVIVTAPASTVPGAPSGLALAWHSGGSILHASWSVPTPGDSPTDDYQVQVARHDPKGPPVILDAGTATVLDTTAFASSADWSVQVRAHNAAGWGAWSKARVLPAF